MWSHRLCRVVKRKSCETYWILLRRLMTSHVSFEVRYCSIAELAPLLNEDSPVDNSQTAAAETSFTSENMLTVPAVS